MTQMAKARKDGTPSNHRGGRPKYMLENDLVTQKKIINLFGRGCTDEEVFASIRESVSDVTLRAAHNWECFLGLKKKGPGPGARQSP